MKLMARIPPLANAMRKKMAKNPGEAARRSIPDPALRARTLAHPEAGPLLIALQASTLHQLRQRLPGTENDIASSRRLFNYPFESLSMPVLIVHGKADRMVPFQQAVFLLTRAPRAELHAIETGEHVVLFTHLDEVRARVSEFLNPGARR